MTIYANRSRFSILLFLILMVAIMVQLWRIGKDHLVVWLLIIAAVVTAVWLVYVLQCVHRVLKVENGRLYIHSYFKHRSYDIGQIESMSVARSGPLLRVAEVRTLKLQVNGRLEKYYMPDFSVRELDKLVLILSRAGAPLVLPEFSLN